MRHRDLVIPLEERSSSKKRSARRRDQIGRLIPRSAGSLANGCSLLFLLTHTRAGAERRGMRQNAESGEFRRVRDEARELSARGMNLERRRFPTRVIPCATESPESSWLLLERILTPSENGSPSALSLPLQLPSASSEEEIYRPKIRANIRRDANDPDDSKRATV